MTFFTFLRFTEQQNMFQVTAVERSYSRDQNSQSTAIFGTQANLLLCLTHKAMNYFYLTRFVGFWLKYMLKDNVDRSSHVYFLDGNSVAVELLPSCSVFFRPKLKHVGEEIKL